MKFKTTFALTYTLTAGLALANLIIHPRLQDSSLVKPQVATHRSTELPTSQAASGSSRRLPTHSASSQTTSSSQKPRVTTVTRNTERMTTGSSRRLPTHSASSHTTPSSRKPRVTTVTQNTEQMTTLVSSRTATVSRDQPATTTRRRSTRDTRPVPLHTTIKPSREPTSVVASCPTPSCSIGVQQSVYENPFKQDTSPDYKTFKPEFFKNKTPRSTDIVNDIYIDNTSGTDKSVQNVAIQYRTYLFACQTGSYRFVSPKVDDIVLMWFGDEALGDWNRANADLLQTFSGPNSTPNKVVSKTIQAGVYYPIRVWFGDTGGASFLSLRIFGPDGRELTGQGSVGKSFLTTEACGHHP